MDVGFVFYRIIPQFIRFAETEAFLDAAARHPNRESFQVVIATHEG